MKRRVGLIELLLFSLVFSFLLYTAVVSCTSGRLSVFSLRDLRISLPSDVPSHVLLVLKLFFWASIEELLYRVYFPNKLEFFFSILFPSCEALLWSLCVWGLPHALFAIAHFYLGFLNVLFAFFASIFLRKLYKYLKYKIGEIFSFAVLCTLHSFYNIFVLYLFVFTHLK